jgi:effector-binding domain-containing protein
MSYQVEVRQVEPHHVAAVEFRANAVDMPKNIGAAFQTVVDYLSKAGIQPTGPAVARYSLPDDNGVFHVAAGFYVDAPFEGDGNVIPVELPAGDAACTTHIGPYQSLPQAYEAIFAWAKQNGRDTDTIMWEEYHSPPETPPSETRTEVYWPLKPR